MQKDMVRAPLFKRLQGQTFKRLHQSDLAIFVGESLNYLLNTRQGMVLSAHDYGLPDYSTITHAPMQLLRIMERQIFEMLKVYEPRLKQVRVQGALDAEFPERMFFSIQAQLSQSARVSYQSMLLPDGRMMVKVA